MSATIDEFHASDHAFSHAGLVGRDQPLVIRGLRGDWPVVAATRESDTVFAARLVDYGQWCRCRYVADSSLI